LAGGAVDGVVKTNTAAEPLRTSNKDSQVEPASDLTQKKKSVTLAVAEKRSDIATAGLVSGNTGNPENDPAAAAANNDEAVHTVFVESFTITSRRLRAFTTAMLPPRWIGGDPDRIARTSAAKPARHEISLVLFAAVAPLIRTPVPALIYPAVYPSEVGYYGLDTALDIFGMGRSPDDNLVLDRKLWPMVEGGTITAPFQFGLYSQIGLGGSLLLSLALGALIGRLWIWILTRALVLLTGPVLAAVAILFTMLLAIDSLRNNVIVSYGLFWAVAFLALYHGFEFVSRSYRSRSR
jgi:hypothetical protein